MDKKASRLQRAAKTRHIIRGHGATRLTVHRTPKHIYAQVIAADGQTVLAAASTLQKDIISEIKYSGNKDAAKAVGKAIATKALAAGVTTVAFDRSGFKYHGRIKELADAAREAGLKF